MLSCLSVRRDNEAQVWADDACLLPNAQCAASAQRLPVGCCSVEVGGHLECFVQSS